MELGPPTLIFEKKTRNSIKFIGKMSFSLKKVNEEKSRGLTAKASLAFSREERNDFGKYTLFSSFQNSHFAIGERGIFAYWVYIAACRHFRSF